MAASEGASEPRQERLFLTGFMGSGKSTVGPLVAARLGWRFEDLDRHVELKAGRPVSEIFTGSGEGAFRAMETEALERVARTPRTVVALGGGTLAQGNNLMVAREAGPIVYLRVPVEVLAERLEATVRQRPMLWAEGGQWLTQDGLRQRIAVLLESRREFYEGADYTVDADGAPDTVAERIMEAIGWAMK